MEIYDYIQMPKPSLPPIPPMPGSDMGVIYQDRYNYPVWDSKLWLELFIITDKHNRNLAEQLDIIRATGAELVFNQQFGFSIQPIIDFEGIFGWKNIEQYQAERERLVPHSDILIQSLGELRRKYDSGKII